MNKQLKMIAIVGATGNVGRKIIEILIQSKIFNPKYLKCFSSSRSAGQQLKINEYEYTIEDMAQGAVS